MVLTREPCRVTHPGGPCAGAAGHVGRNTSYTFSFYALNNGALPPRTACTTSSHGADIVSSTPYISNIDGSTWTQVNVTFTTTWLHIGCTSLSGCATRVPRVDILLWRATLTVNLRLCQYFLASPETR